MEKKPFETLKDLLNSIKDLFTKNSDVTAQVVVSKIKKIVEQWKKDLKEKVVRPFGKEEIDVTMYGANRELRENFTRFLDLLGKAGDVENQVALSEKVKGIDDEVRRLNQQREKIKDEKTRELVGMTAMELNKEKEDLTLKFEKELEGLGASSIKFKNIIFTILKTIEAGPSSISQVNLLNAVNGMLEKYPVLENEEMLVDLIIAGRGEKVVYKEKLEKEEPEGVVPLEKEKKIPEKVWEERRESVNFDTIYGALDWITDIGEKMTRAITWLKNKAKGVFDWIRDSGSAIHETTEGIDQLTGALENIYSEYSATGTVEGRLASQMREIKSEREFNEVAKRFGAIMDENIKPRRRGKPLTDEERLKRHKGLYPEEDIKSEEELPERGTGLRGEEIEKRRKGIPLTDKERLKRHKKLYPGETLPERGTGLKRESTGEADQDYDHEFFDNIVKQLEAQGIQGATHREFDKYQGVYIDVLGVDTFWISEVYYTGEKEEEYAKMPYSKVKLINPDGNLVSPSYGDYFMVPDDYVFEDYTLYLTLQNGEEEVVNNPQRSQLPDITEVADTFTLKKETESEHVIFYPEEDPEIGIEVTDKNGVVDASELVGYCVSESGVKKSSKKLAGEFGDFIYVTIEELDNGNLEIFPKETLKEDEQLDLYEIFEDVIGNSILDWVAPEDIGALTDAPLLGEVDISDEGEITEVHNIWWFPNYAIVDPEKELREGNSIVFEKAE